MYLSAGICTALIIIGGGSMKLFYEILCGPECRSKPLTAIEWYLVFTCAAVLISQLPNLNSIAGVSLVGSITAVAYCTILWVLSLAKGRPEGVSYTTVEGRTEVESVLGVLNGIGIIAFAFRGHNLVLEIQVTCENGLETSVKQVRSFLGSCHLIDMVCCRRRCHQPKSIPLASPCGKA